MHLLLAQSDDRIMQLVPITHYTAHALSNLVHSSDILITSVSHVIYTTIREILRKEAMNNKNLNKKNPPRRKRNKIMEIESCMKQVNRDVVKESKRVVRRVDHPTFKRQILFDVV